MNPGASQARNCLSNRSLIEPVNAPGNVGLKASNRCAKSKHFCSSCRSASLRPSFKSSYSMICSADKMYLCIIHSFRYFWLCAFLKNMDRDDFLRNGDARFPRDWWVFEAVLTNSGQPLERLFVAAIHSSAISELLRRPYRVFDGLVTIRSRRGLPWSRDTWMSISTWSAHPSVLGFVEGKSDLRPFDRKTLCQEMSSGLSKLTLGIVVFSEFNSFLLSDLLAMEACRQKSFLFAKSRDAQQIIHKKTI